ncbi:uncharacterized protein [Antedon mediterranea]|uniref:uncharacterized protein isoform X2 n=1 Tax=Antedon mediterranea TaxID=105859 RepID=UPI003AF4F407
MLSIFFLGLLFSSTSAASSCGKVINYKKEPHEGSFVEEFSGDETNCVYRFIAPPGKYVVVGIREMDIFSSDIKEIEDCKLRLNVRDTPTNGDRELLHGFCTSEGVDLPTFFQSSDSRIQLVYKGQSSRTDGRLEVQYAFVDSREVYMKSMLASTTAATDVADDVLTTQNMTLEIITEIVDEPEGCGIRVCYEYCPNGYEKDENGCETCTCLPEPKGCGIRVCYEICITGYEIDENGCDTCTCLPIPTEVIEVDAIEVVDMVTETTTVEKPGCGIRVCYGYCPNGYEKDENGCETCTCLPVQCEPIPLLCKAFCALGNNVDEDGCEVCSCKEDPQNPGCPALICPSECDHGKEVDKNNCETCVCLDPPVPTEVIEVVTEVVEMATEQITVEEAEGCGIRICYEICLTGYEIDGNGCDTCTCLPGVETTDEPTVDVVTEIVETITIEDFVEHSCPTIVCYVYCPGGYAKDDSNCTTCTCIEVFIEPPSEVSAKLNDNVVILEWKKSTSDVDRYVVQYLTQYHDLGWQQIASVSANFTSTIISVMPGLEYTFRVIAESAIGRSKPSKVSNVITTPPGIPGQNPQNVNVRFAEDSLITSWDVVSPLYYGGSDMQYILSIVSLTSGKTWTFNVTSSASSYTLSGIDLSESFSVTLQSSNSIGSGPVPAPLESSAPQPPSNVNAELREANVVFVEWKKSTSDVDRYIVQYLTQYHDLGWQQIASVSGDVNNTAFDVLPGLQYTFRVVAENENGRSKPSKVSNVITTAPGVPGRNPEKIDISFSEHSLNIGWSAISPLYSGSSGVGYILTIVSLTSGQSWTFNVSHSTTSYTLKGIDTSDSYSVTLQSFNSIGSGPVPSPSESGIPLSPSNVRAKLQESDVVFLQWDQSSSYVYRYIIEYRTQYHDLGWQQITKAPGSSNSTLIYVLSGLDYSFRIFAENDNGRSEPSPVSNTVSTAPGAPDQNPKNIKFSFTRDSLLITWSAISPLYQGHSDAQYNLTITSLSSHRVWKYSLSPSTSQYVLSNIDTSEDFSVSIQTVNPLGSGPPPASGVQVIIDDTEVVVPTKKSDSVTVSEHSCPTIVCYVYCPGGYAKDDSNCTTCTCIEVFIEPPSEVGAELNDNVVILQWKKSTSDVDRYVVQYLTQYHDLGWQQIASVSVNFTSTIISVMPGLEYTFRVVAESAIGRSKPSKVSNVITTPPGIPGQNPQNVNVRFAEDSLITSWDVVSPLYYGGSDMQYILSIVSLTSGQTWTFNVTSSASSYTLSGIDLSESFSVTLQSSNSIGSGPVPAPLESSPPQPPSNVNAELREANIVFVEWKKSTSDVDRYIVQYLTQYHDLGWQQIASVSGDVNNTAFDVLPGLQYTFRVIAENENGRSKPSKVSNVITTAPGVPGRNPEKIDISFSEHSLNIGWSAISPLYSGSSGVGYILTIVSLTSGQSWTFNVSHSTTSYTLKGIDTSDSYSVTLQSFNSIGSGPVPSPSESGIPLSPSNVRAKLQESDVVFLQWDQSSSYVYRYIIEYRTQYHDLGWQQITKAPGSSNSTLIYVLSGLDYSFRIFAENDNGRSEPSPVSNTVSTAPGAPGQNPKNIKFSFTGDSLLITWSAISPLYQGHSDAQYNLTITSLSSHRVWKYSLSPSTSQYVLSNIDTSEDFSVSIQTVNPLGSGPPPANGVLVVVPAVEVVPTAKSDGIPVTVSESSECGIRVCYGFCPGVYEIDDNGCYTCNCLPGATLEPVTEDGKCGSIVCYAECPNGYATDENDCVTCDCLPDDGATVTDFEVEMVTEIAGEVDGDTDCGIVICYGICTDGYLLDDHGCYTCTCLPAPTKIPVEEVTQPTNQVTVEESICGNIFCFVYCKAGYVKMENGCPTCDCLPVPEEIGVTPTKQAEVEFVTEGGFEPVTATESVCGNIFCYIYCEAGYVKMENGCFTCDCLPEDDEVVPTPGAKGVSSSGAELEIVTEAIESYESVTVEEPEDCGIRVCYGSCPAGYAKDDRGCFTCECLPDTAVVPTQEADEVTATIEKEVEPVTEEDIAVVATQKVVEVTEVVDITPSAGKRCIIARDNSDGGFSPTCDENGDYEPMQCPPLGNCICVDTVTGEPLGPASGTPPSCKAAPCSGFTAICKFKRTCEFGYDFDDGDCFTCKCKKQPEVPSTCSPIICSNLCEHGNQVDENGCEICDCNPPPDPTCLLPVSCLIYCIYGHEADENGCETCQCKPPPPEPTCPPFVCFIYCEHGNQVDENGCEMCECNPPPEPTCPPFVCFIYCEHGNQVDENGCEICECNPPPEPTCPPFVCFIYCKHGNQVDENGCEICECNPPPEPTCPPFLCFIYCEHGNQVDENGCEICECNPPPEPTCPPFVCFIYCEHGNQVDENGCEICECNPPPEPTCPPFVCFIYCEHGNQVDENGCEICECNPPPEPTCPPFVCFIYCEHGNQVDENGCEICECNPPPEPTCPPFVCFIYCEHGNQVDENGCEICECNPPPEPTCPPFVCFMYCEHGNQVDENGCEICECNPPPEPTCPPFLCLIFCKHGNQVDENGCEVCACNAPPEPACPPFVCTIFCEHGNQVDSNGCEICSCNLPPAPTCPPINCDLSCGFGFVEDSETGCDICECFNPFRVPVCETRTCKIDCGPIGYILDASGCSTCRCNYVEEVPIPPRISKVSRTRSVGKELELRCEAEGADEPSISWRKDGVTITSADGVTLDGNTLRIEERNAHDNGMYRCVASNNAGTAESAPLELRVPYMDSVPFQPILTHEVTLNNFTKLHCDSPNSYPPPRVFWSRGRYNNPLVYDSRVYQDNENNLVISNMKEEDVDVYVCSIFNDVIFKALYSRVHRLILSDDEPTAPRQVQLATALQDTVYAASGDTFSLWCSPQAFPTPTTTWDKIGGAIPEAVFTNGGLKMTVFNAAYEDSGRYRCTSQNGVGDQFEGFVDVIVGDKPSWLTEMQDVVLSVGDDITLTCEAEAVPDVSYDWFFNGQQLSISYLPYNVRFRDNRLQIVSANVENRGVYTCRASNVFGTIITNVAINVVEFSPRILETSNVEWRVAEGSHVALRCEGYGAPAPTTTWRTANGDEIVAGYKFEFVEGGYLVIRHIEVYEGGVYTCVVGNGESEVQIDFNVIVEVSDKIQMVVLPSSRTLVVGQSTSFMCQIRFSTTEVRDIIWQGPDGQNIGENVENFVVDDDNTLTVLSARLEDEGPYSCLARTDRVQERVTVNLYVKDVPLPPTAVKVEKQEDLVVTLAWSSSSDGNSPILRYIVQYMSQHEEYGWRILEEVAGPYSSTVLSLLPGNQYTFRLLAENDVGRSAPSLPSNQIETAPGLPSRNPENVEARISGSTLVIVWSAVDPIYWGSSDAQYILQIASRDTTESWDVLLTMSSTSYVLNDINTSYRYFAKIRTTNSYGSGPVARPFISDCQPVQCDFNCVNGYVLDSDGCETCQCATPTVPPTEGHVACVTVTCVGLCPGRRKVDENGCQTCECVEQQAPSYAPVACAVYACIEHCEFGGVIDGNGCETCTCRQQEGPECLSLPAECSSLYCSDGYLKDQNGCNTCECNYLVNVTEDGDYSGGVECPPFICDKFCFFGYETDMNYCRTCSCMPVVEIDFEEQERYKQAEAGRCPEEQRRRQENVDAILNSEYSVGPFPEPQDCDKDGNFVQQSCTVEEGCVCVDKIYGSATQLEYPECDRFKPCMLDYTGRIVEALRSAGYTTEADEVDGMINKNDTYIIKVLATIDEERISKYLVNQYWAECDGYGNYLDTSIQLSTGSKNCNYRNGSLIPGTRRTVGEEPINCRELYNVPSPIEFDAQPSDMTAEAGSTIILPCTFSKVEGYVYWVKDSEIPVNVYPHSRYYVDRNDAEMTYNLVIYDVQKEDEGQYHCGVTSLPFYESSTTAQLTVTEAPGCPALTDCLLVYCSQGYVKDENGCDTCECYQPDSHSTTLTKCQPFNCSLECNFGYVTDNCGCSVCECNDSDYSSSIFETSAGDDCPPFICNKFCFFGFERGDDYCRLCSCLPKVELPTKDQEAEPRCFESRRETLREIDSILSEDYNVAPFPEAPECDDEGYFVKQSCTAETGCICVDEIHGRVNPYQYPDCNEYTSCVASMSNMILEAIRSAGYSEEADEIQQLHVEKNIPEVMNKLALLDEDLVSVYLVDQFLPECDHYGDYKDKSRQLSTGSSMCNYGDGTLIQDSLRRFDEPPVNCYIYLVDEAPTVIFDVEPSDVTAAIGSSVNMICSFLEVEGYVYWFKDDIPVNVFSHGRYRVVRNEGDKTFDLVIIGVEKEDEGSYRCGVTARSSSILSSPARLVIEETSEVPLCAQRRDELNLNIELAQKLGIEIPDFGKLPACASDGRYEVLQCFDGVGCYCADPETGDVNSDLVPPSCVPFDQLTCAEFAEIYRRQLASGLIADPEIQLLTCSEDGNYDAQQCRSDFGFTDCICVDIRTGKPNGLTSPNCMTPTGKCAQKAAAVNQQLAEAAKLGTEIADLVPPACSPDGNYVDVQCSLEPLGCYCVDIITGEKTGKIAPDCSHDITELQGCAKEAAEINQRLQDAYRSGTIIADLSPPTCTPDGNYALGQCLALIGCYCVDEITGDPTGLTYPECEPEQQTCAEEAAAINKDLDDAIKRGTIIADLTPPACTPDGNYALAQCYALIGCYCVDAITGDQTGLTYPECGTEQQTCADKAAAINKELDDARERGAIIADLTPPACTPDGNYALAQCYALIGCFCVDAITGEKTGLTYPECGREPQTCADRAAAVNKRLDDAIKAGEFIADLAPPNCTPDGNYVLVQCHPLIGCYCVDAITGDQTGLTYPECGIVTPETTCLQVVASINEQIEDAEEAGRSTEDLVAPQCTQDGTFKLLQCIPKQGCFCVNPETGINSGFTAPDCVSYEVPEVTCIQKREFIEQQKAEAISQGSPAPNIVPLTCSEDGLYREVQCHNSNCFLVDVNNGNFIRNIEIEATERTPTTERAPPVGQGSCSREAAEVHAQLAEAAQQGAFIADLNPPDCTDDGNYNPIQCNYPIPCHCADIYTGDPNFYLMPACDTPSECGAVRQISIDANEDFIPKCDFDGTFLAYQCKGSICWCATADGAPIDGTTHRSGESQNCNLQRRKASEILHG